MILDEICDHKRVEVAEAKRDLSMGEVERLAGEADPPRGFRAALRQPGVSLIAEIKRASPTRGPLMRNIEPPELGNLYADAGAAALSILTDRKYFNGSLDDFRVVRRQVGIPCLRKEFVVDPYQIYEARAAGADAILLIVRILSDAELSEFLNIAQDLKMDVLVETHDAEEIERALKAGAHIIGINNRDLATFEVDLARTLELKRHVPGGHVLVSESGISTAEDVKRLADGGVDAILVGEALVTAGDIRQKVRELIGHDES